MGRLIDLTGQQFGYWTVIEKVPLNKSGSNWLCKCKCGKEKIINGYNLRKGLSTSCGCKNAKKLGESNLIDLTGQHFGEWTVIKISNKKSTNNIKYWTCQCSCGNIVDVRGDILRNGHSQSCGCQRKNSHGELKIENLLKENNIFYYREYSFDDCIFPDTNKCAKFDFYINNKYLIEYDGSQHFENINNYHGTWDLSKVQNHDIYKNQWCKENNIPLIRIPYTHLPDLCIEDLLLETSKFII